MKIRNTPIVRPIITVLRNASEPGCAECDIFADLEPRARLRLFPGHFLSLMWHVRTLVPAAILALGRELAAHAAIGNPADLRAADHTLKESGRGRPGAGWRDLPEVVTTPVEPADRLGACAAACGDDRVILFLTHDTAVPLVNLRFSRIDPPEPLLVEVARMAADYSDAFRNAPLST
jgi:hypothetical protein